MKILAKNLKHNEVKLEIENLEDLWYLSYIIEPGDSLRARTIRKLKIGESDQRSVKIIKKPMTLTISLEKIEFHKYSDVLRASGTITAGPEDLSMGSHHTINITVHTQFTLIKKEFLRYQLEKLKEASEDKGIQILVCVHDREEAIFASIKKYGYEVLTQIRGQVQKKAEKTESKDFYAEIIKLLQKYEPQYDSIILASPSFWKEYVLEKLDARLQKKIVPASCSSVSTTGINELMKREEIKKALQQSRFASEIGKVETVLTEISKDGKVAYGMDEVTVAVESGAVKDLLVTDNLVHEMRQNSSFDKLDRVMKLSEKSEGTVMIVSSEHEGGQKLDGLGGIAALLRFKLHY